MSQNDVEIARAMIDTWNRGDVDEWLKTFHADVELVDFQTAMGMQERGRGLDELRRMSSQWTEIFDDWRVELRELVDLGDGYVMADLRFDGVGRDSGAPVSSAQFDIYRVAEGKIVAYRAGFRDRAEALEAVGLRE